MASYWAPDLELELSQGDLLVDAWIGTTVSPRVALTRGATGKGGIQNWQEVANLNSGSDGTGHFLGRARPAPCLVLSQSCEIDKKGGKAPVLIAPVIELASTVKDEALRQQYRERGRFAFFPLPEISGVLPESYVDLRAISYMPRAVLDEMERAASASVSGLRELTAHLVGFFTRVDLDQLAKAG